MKPIKRPLFAVFFFFQEKAVKWHSGEEIDGLTTNGVFIMSPTEGFTPASKPGTWYEVSVGGGIYSARNSRADPLKSHQVYAFVFVCGEGVCFPTL